MKCLSHFYVYIFGIGVCLGGGVMLSGCLDLSGTLVAQSLPPKTNKSIHFPKEKLGFRLNENSSLGENPQDGRAKICLVSFFDNTKMAFPVYFEYNPQLSKNGTYAPNEAKSQGSFGEMSGRGGFCIEVASGYDLSVFTLGKYPSFVVFSPASGKTYCIRGDIVGGDFSQWLSLSFSTRAHCEYFFAQMKKNQKHKKGK